MRARGITGNPGHSYAPGQSAASEPAPEMSARARATDSGGTVATGGTARGIPGRGGGGSVASTPIFEAVLAPSGNDGSRLEPDKPSMMMESRDH